MVGVELISDSGQELNLLPGKEAEITMEIPDVFMSTAPNNIPLWNFDEDEGIWKEEGMAVLEGNQYVGKVSHFSWWNCDLPNSILPFCITIFDAQTGLEMPNTYVTFSNTGGFGFASGYTNHRGQLCGFIPENMELEVNVGVNLVCQNIGSGQVIGPFTTADLPIVLTHQVNLNGQVVNSIIDGMVTDCNGVPVPNAFVIFKWGTESESALTDANGNYSQNLTSCNEIVSLEVQAISLALGKEDTEVVANVNGGTTTVDLDLCNDFVVTNWFFTSASMTVMFSDVIAKVKPFETQIIVSEINAVELMGFECFTTGPCQGSYVGSVGNFSVDIEITKYGPIGGTIEGSFSGTDTNGELIMGSFKADRVE